MKSILLAGAMFAVVFGCYFLFLRTKEHVVPENFPILTPAESKSDKPELFPILPAANSMNDATMASGSQLATFGSGCFWCTEAYFLQMKGVQKVVSGYCGGTVANPTYEQICTGNTGHAEVIQVTYDPNVVTYGDLLELFWRSLQDLWLKFYGLRLPTVAAINGAAPAGGCMLSICCDERVMLASAGIIGLNVKIHKATAPHRWVRVRLRSFDA